MRGWLIRRCTVSSLVSLIRHHVPTRAIVSGIGGLADALAHPTGRLRLPGVGADDGARACYLKALRTHPPALHTTIWNRVHMRICPNLAEPSGLCAAASFQKGESWGHHHDRVWCVILARRAIELTAPHAIGALLLPLLAFTV